MNKKAIMLIVLLAASSVGAVSGYINYKNNVTGKEPVIECKEDVLSVSTSDDESVLLKDVQATDPEDGDLSNAVYVDEIYDYTSDGKAKVRYVVFDSNNNSAELIRKIQYTDYEPMKFALKEPLIFNSSLANISFSSYIGAEDCLDGDISSHVIATAMDMATEGTLKGQYMVTFLVKNSREESEEIQIPVLNEEAKRPQVELSTYLLYASKGDKINPETYIEQVLDSAGAKCEYTLDSTNYTETSLSEGILFVNVDDNLDTSEPGIYYIYYSTIDATETTGACVLTVVIR